MPIHSSFEGAQDVGGGKHGGWEGVPDLFSAYAGKQNQTASYLSLEPQLCYYVG